MASVSVGRRGAGDLVREFHEAIHAPDYGSPTIPCDERLELRHRLIEEEAIEALIEFENAQAGNGDLAAIAKELADIVYVTYGAALELGIDLDAVLEVVHISNMAKLDGPVRSDGKQLKPDGWTEPDIGRVLGL